MLKNKNNFLNGEVTCGVGGSVGLVIQGSVENDWKIPSELLFAVLMNGKVGSAKIAQQVKIVFQPLLSSIRARTWNFLIT